MTDNPSTDEIIVIEPDRFLDHVANGDEATRRYLYEQVRQGQIRIEEKSPATAGKPIPGKRMKNE